MPDKSRQCNLVAADAAPGEVTALVPVCEVRGLTKTYRSTGVVANRNIDLAVRPGEIVGVFGPNGAGKTTLVRQIMGLLRPSAGSISVCGRDIVAHPQEAPRYAAYLPQRVPLFASHRVLDVLVAAGALRGMPSRDALRRAEALLERFGLAPRARSLMFRCSGGERQLALFLSAFMGERPLVILDEPTSHLDPVRRTLAWEFLREQAQEGVAVMLVTHNVSEADQVVDRVVIIDQGTVVADATPGELKRRVSEQVEIRLTLKPGATLPPDRGVPASHITGQRWLIRIRPEECPRVLSALMETPGLSQIDDFSVTGTSMDTVYEALTGKWWDGRHEQRTG